MSDAPVSSVPSIHDAEITFGGGRRDRADRLRGDPETLDRLVRSRNAFVLPVWRGKPLVILDGDGARLGWLAPGAEVLSEATEPPVFLGLSGEDGCFAADVSAWIDPAAPDGPAPGFSDRTMNHHPSLPESARFVELRGVMGDLDAQDAADAATAKGILEWHRSHRFCARCGQPSTIEAGGWRRVCGACGGQHFPRTDPVVIMLITRGDRVLLGRQPFWPEGMHSLLAGFVEPGETLEAAVRRETSEEAGIPVGRVHYLASQPWPFPASLMIGCAGEALDDVITLDEKELESALWVPRAEIAEALAGRHPSIAPARPGAIARTLLDAWAEGRVPDFG
jgi:NAD+ diphosphatase